MKVFISPKINRFLFFIVDHFYKPILKILQNINSVEIDAADIALLKSLKDKRLIFFTNHPTTAEPPIVMRISQIIGARFKFMASRQVFAWGGGLIGFLIRRLGAYSVIAGISDRESLKTTRNILAAKAGKLAIFPEGEPTSGENDNLMPFQPGIAQLGFWGLEDAKKNEPDADITILSAFLKYTFNASEAAQKKALANSLQRLEKKLAIAVPASKSALERLLSIARVLLEQQEQKYQINLRPERLDDFEYRAGRVRHSILNNVAEKLKIKNFNQEQDAILKFRQVFSTVELYMIGYQEPTLAKIDKKTVRWALRECIVAFDFITIEKKLLLAYPSCERMFEWIDRFNSLVLGTKPRLLGGVPSRLPRKVHISFSEPFLLSEYYSNDREKKRQLQKNFLDRIQKDMQQMLEKNLSRSKPLSFEKADR